MISRLLRTKLSYKVTMLYQVSKASKYYGVDTIFEDVNF